MPRSPRASKRFAPRSSALAAISLSAIAHLLFGVVADQVLTVPNLDIEFSVPIDVELGMAEPMAAAEVPPPSAEPAPSPAPVAGPDGEKEKPKKPERPDAGVADAAVADAGETVDAGPTDAGGVGVPDGGSRIPEGAQIALRVDMARIRASIIAEDVRGLLAAVPDWRALLSGSGIDPVTQLDRLLLATPDLSREKVVIAGRYVGGVEVVEQAVAELASAHGTSAPWGKTSGVRSAPWANDDVTERVIALVGPQHFVIARPADLPRVLAIAATRSSRKKAGSEPVVHPAEALLSMEGDEGLSLEVEGVGKFVRRARPGIPRTLRISASEVDAEHVRIRARMTFPSDDDATTALAFWEQARMTYARNPLVVLLGLGAPLANAELAQAESDVRVELTLDAQQTRLILGYVRELVTPPAPRPAPAPGP